MMEVLVTYQETPLSKLTVVALKELIAQKTRDKEKVRTSRLSKKELVTILSQLCLAEELVKVWTNTNC